MCYLNIYSQHLRKEKQQLVEIKLLKQTIYSLDLYSTEAASDVKHLYCHLPKKAHFFTLIEDFEQTIQ